MKNILLVVLIGFAILLAGCGSIPQGGNVTVYVTDDQGNPVDGASVNAYTNYYFNSQFGDKWQSLSGSIASSVTTNAKGIATLQLLPSKYAFQVYKDNANGTIEQEIITGQNTVNITIKKPTVTTSFKITINDETGKIIEPPINYDGKVCITNKAGEEECSKLGIGNFTQNPYSTSTTSFAHKEIIYTLRLFKDRYEDAPLEFTLREGDNLDLTAVMQRKGAGLLKNSLWVRTIAVGSTTGVGYVEILRAGETSMETYKEGEIIKGLIGNGPYAGRGMMVELVQVVQYAPSPSEYEALFELYADSGELIDRSVAWVGEDLKYGFSQNSMEFYNEGQTITNLAGAGQYDGKIMSVKVKRIVQYGTQNFYRANFELYDNQGNLVDTRTIGLSEELNKEFLDSQGNTALKTTVFLSMIRIGATTGVGFVVVSIRERPPVPSIPEPVFLMNFENGKFEDLSPNNNTISLVGTPTIVTNNCRNGSCASLTQNNGIKITTNKFNFESPSGPSTLVLDAYFTDTKGYSVFGTCPRTSESNRWTIIKNQSTLAGQIFDSSVTGLKPIELNKWYNVALVHGGYGLNTVSFYIDGVLQGTTTIEGNVPPTGYTGYMDAASFRLGQDTCWGSYMNGLIDNVTIFNQPLQQEDIQKIISQ